MYLLIGFLVNFVDLIISKGPKNETPPRYRTFGPTIKHFNPILLVKQLLRLALYPTGVFHQQATGEQNLLKFEKSEKLAQIKKRSSTYCTLKFEGGSKLSLGH